MLAPRPAYIGTFRHMRGSGESVCVTCAEKTFRKGCCKRRMQTLHPVTPPSPPPPLLLPHLPPLRLTSSNLVPFTVIVPRPPAAAVRGTEGTLLEELDHCFSVVLFPSIILHIYLRIRASFFCFASVVMSMASSTNILAIHPYSIHVLILTSICILFYIIPTFHVLSYANSLLANLPLIYFPILFDTLLFFYTLNCSLHPQLEPWGNMRESSGRGWRGRRGT